jgi:hypothetical protein
VLGVSNKYVLCFVFICIFHLYIFIWFFGYIIKCSQKGGLYMGLIQTPLTFVSRECREQFLGYVLATFHNRAIIEPKCSQEKTRFSKNPKKSRKKCFYKNQISYHFQCGVKTQLRSPDFSVRQKKIISNIWKMDIYCFLKNVQNEKVKGSLTKYLGIKT